MTIKDLKGVHALLVDDKWIDAATLILLLAGKTGIEVRNKAQALSVCRNLFQHLLDNEKYLEAATLQWGPDIFNTEPESVVRSFEAMRKGNTILLMGASSMGKCLSPETKVRMFDGSVREAQYVHEGDVLMGDDSGPRRVLKANPGYGALYKITPERGDSWICNSDHILSLRTSTTKKCGNSHQDSKLTFKGRVVDIPIEDYLKMAPSRKAILKQYHVGVEYDYKAVPFDPYIYGAWLGDGGTDVPCLHTPEGPMSTEWVRYFESIGYRVSVGYQQDTCKMWSARTKTREGNCKNEFTSFIRTSVIQEKKEKFIRDDYMINSRAMRMRLLAGLIDSDGWVSVKTSYGFVSKFPALANQVKMLARSLGYAATVYPKKCGIKSIGFSAIYWHVQISGRGITDIPTLEKHAVESTTTKNLTNTGFKVDKIPDGPFYGFVIDGNHRFLLEDYTVTHNTYGAGAWLLLDYLRDPQYTTVKLAAINEDHLKKNLFAHVATLYRCLAIPMAQDIQVRDSDLWMGVKEAGYEFGISGIAFKQSQETSGQFKGYKAKPVRTKRHPKFGVMSRLRVLGDEAQNWPNGPFKDFNSLVASKTGSELIKIACAFNPESISQHVVSLAEPPDGWTLEGMETQYDWLSRHDWLVCRLDAARSENVIQKRKVFEGLQTHEGFMGYLKSGGDTSANYSTFARGWPPMSASVNTIIPPTWPQEARGEATFLENPIVCAAADLAFMGKDSAQMAIGRWGLASGYRDHNNIEHKFKDRKDITKLRPRHVLQLDQIMPLQKHDDTVRMAEEIIGRCNMLQIKPEWVAVDKTGYGFGTWSHLTRVWGEILGVSWNEKATEKKILAEDKDAADKQVEGVMSEMWWALRRWIDPTCKAVLINPIIPAQLLHSQLTSRRYKNGKQGIKVEPKEDYVSRTRLGSPDESDAVCMLLHLIRQRSDVLPGLTEQTAPSRTITKDHVVVKLGSAKDMLDSGDMPENDSICGDSRGE